MDFFAAAYSDKRPRSPLLHPHHIPQGGVGYGCESNAHLRRASSGLEAEYGPNPRRPPSPCSYSSYTSASPTWIFERQPKYVTRQDARGEVDHPSDRESTPTNYIAAAHNATDRTAALPDTPLHPGSVRGPLYRRTSLTNPCLIHHASSGGAVRPPLMPKSSSANSLLDLPHQEVDHNSHPRFFSNTKPSTSVEEREAKT